MAGFGHVPSIKKQGVYIRSYYFIGQKIIIICIFIVHWLSFLTNDRNVMDYPNQINDFIDHTSVTWSKRMVAVGSCVLVYLFWRYIGTPYIGPILKSMFHDLEGGPKRQVTNLILYISFLYAVLSDVKFPTYYGHHNSNRDLGNVYYWKYRETYIFSVLDAEEVVAWGKVKWDADVPKGYRVKVFARSVEDGAG